MNERIALVLKTKDISPAQLADDLGVQRSGISHILNGRNKPSLDFVQKLIKQYPDISMNWILFGEGPMMKPYSGTASETSLTSPSVSKPQPQAFTMELFAGDYPDKQIQPEETEEKSDKPMISGLENQGNTPDFSIKKNQPETSQKNNLPDPSEEISQEVDESIRRKSASPERKVVERKTPVQQHATDRRIIKVLVFYSDRTFVEYQPGEED